jgi:hypothetical protein
VSLEHLLSLGITLFPHLVRFADSELAAAFLATFHYAVFCASADALARERQGLGGTAEQPSQSGIRAGRGSS